MRLVLDCNVIIGAGLKSGGTCYLAIREVLLNHQCFVSEKILAEYRATINKPKFRKDKEALAIILNNIIKIAEEVTAGASPFKLADSDDEIYLATAITAKADILLTGDLTHFPEPYYETVRILRPHEFLSLYGK
jgi:putative PIN family toxin of toxin-antitoxin system